MVWPFGKKRAKPEEAPAPQAARPEAPRAADADERILAEIQAWLGGQRNAPQARRAETAPEILLGDRRTHIKTRSDAPACDAGARLKVKRGKLSWVDLYDPELRPIVDALVAYLDKQQKWSFNGVIRTRYEE